MIFVAAHNVDVISRSIGHGFPNKQSVVRNGKIGHSVERLVFVVSRNRDVARGERDFIVACNAVGKIQLFGAARRRADSFVDNDCAQRVDYFKPDRRADAVPGNTLRADVNQRQSRASLFLPEGEKRGVLAKNHSVRVHIGQSVPVLVHAYPPALEYISLALGRRNFKQLAADSLRFARLAAVVIQIKSHGVLRLSVNYRGKSCVNGCVGDDCGTEIVRSGKVFVAIPTDKNTIRLLRLRDRSVNSPSVYHGHGFNRASSVGVEGHSISNFGQKYKPLPLVRQLNPAVRIRCGELPVLLFEKSQGKNSVFKNVSTRLVVAQNNKGESVAAV